MERVGFRILLTLLTIGTLTAGLRFKIHEASTAEVEGNSPPSFVTENKLVYQSGAVYQWLDPHVSYYQIDYWTLWHSVEMLLWYEKDNASKIIPWLSESYVRSDDGLYYNFTLRQGITFQDGTSFNASTVWFSLNRLLIIDGTSGNGIVHGSQAAWMVQQLLDPYGHYFAAMGAKPSYDAGWVDDVLSLHFVEIIDEYTVKVNIATPTTQFLSIMAGPWAAIISPVSTIELDYEEGGWGTWDGNYTTYFIHMAGNGETGLNLPENGWRIGTGAYYIDSVNPTSYKIVLKAYANYWGGPDDMNLPPQDKTRIETIEFEYEWSFSTRLSNLEAGEVTGIAVPTSDIFQVIDRTKWIDLGVLESIVSNATVHGAYPQLTTWWFCFDTNVTDIDGVLKEWQPFADWRIRMAVACAVNMTYININVNNRTGVLADNIIPPSTFPAGSYNPDVEPTFSFNLTRVEELLNACRDNPMTSATHNMHYYNGTPVAAGVVDNSFGSDFANAKVVEFYVQEGATAFIEVLTALIDNLNTVCAGEDLGIRFSVVVVPSGQQYTLASQHLIDGYMGGWICDYNHVLNWLQPMYTSTGVYGSWNQWNVTQLDNLYDEAVIADEEGNMTRLLEINDEMNTLANDMLLYMVWWHPVSFFTRSPWLKGWYLNPSFGVDLWSSMYYEEPMHDIAITDVTPSKTVVGQNYSMFIDVTLENKGDFTEDFNVTVYCNDTAIISADGKDYTAITLASGVSTNITFTWNTTDLPKSNYTISAFATPVPDETYTDDNVFNDGWVIIAMVGDITGPENPPGSGKKPPDGECDMRDVGLVARCFGQDVPPAPAICDISGQKQGVPDGEVDMRDIGLVARHFGETDP